MLIQGQEAYHKELVRKKLNQQILSKIWSKSMKYPQQLQVGVKDFVEVATKHQKYYIDKTYFIKNLFQLFIQSIRVIIITRPKGWGKSLTMSMLKYFLNKEVDENGIALAPQPYTKLFQGGNYIVKQGRSQRQIVLSRLKICNDKNRIVFRQYHSTFSVIFLEFKNIQGNSFAQLKRNLVRIIYKSYKQHEYLRKFQQYRQSCAQLQRILSISDQLMQLQPIHPFLKNLCQCLQQFNQNNRSLVLIDDLDYPVLCMHKIGGNLVDATRTAQLIIDIIKPLVAFSTGLKVICIGKLNIFDDLMTNYKHFSVFQHQFQNDFGFNQDQFQKFILTPLLDSCQEGQTKIKAFLKQRIIQFYGGYQYGCYSYTKIQPFSALSYLQSCLNKKSIIELRNYWKQQTIDWYLNSFIELSGIPKILNYCYQGHLESKKQNFYLRKLTNQKRSVMQIEQMNNIMCSFGFFVGELIFQGKWMIKQQTIPNKSVRQKIQNVLWQFMQKQLKLRNKGLMPNKQ